jgi:RHS repeat-associated protein
MNGATLTKAFVPLTGGATAVYTSSGLAYYRHTDHLGSSRFASTPARTLYSDTAYSPYGEPYASSGSIDNSFTGQNQDTTAGLYDFLFRKQDPNQGRWTSPDPAGLAAVNPANPQSWNRYGYVRNMPLTLIDPLGLCPPVVQNRDSSDSQDTKSGGPSATDSEDLTEADPQGAAGGTCQSSPWYYGGGGGGGFSLDGGYNGDDSGFGVGFPAGASGGIGGPTFLLTTSEVPNPDWWTTGCIEAFDCGNIPAFLEVQTYTLVGSLYPSGNGGGGGSRAPFLPSLTPQQLQKPVPCEKSTLGAEFGKATNNASTALIKDVGIGEGLAFAFGCLAGAEVGCLAPGGAVALAAVPLTFTGASLHATYLAFKPVAQYAYNGYVCNNPQDTFF